MNDLDESEPLVRESFTFWRSFLDSIVRLQEPDQLAVFLAIANYGLDGKEPDLDALSGAAAAAWCAMRPNIRKGLVRANSGHVGGLAGRGVPRNFGNQNAAKRKQNESKTIAEQKHEEIDGDNKPKTEDEEVRSTRAAAPDSSGFEISPPSPSADFAGWASNQKDPVTVALDASGEGDGARRVYGSRLAALRRAFGKDEGARKFIEVCVAFHAERVAGEEPRNPGKVLVARLDALLGQKKDPATPPPSPRTTSEPPPPAEEPVAASSPPPKDGARRSVWIDPPTILATAQRRGARTADDVRKVAHGMNATERAEEEAVRMWEASTPSSLSSSPAVHEADTPGPATTSSTPASADSHEAWLDRGVAWIEAQGVGNAREARALALRFDGGNVTLVDADEIVRRWEARRKEGTR